MEYAENPNKKNPFAPNNICDKCGKKCTKDDGVHRMVTNSKNQLHLQITCYDCLNNDEEFSIID